MMMQPGYQQPMMQPGYQQPMMQPGYQQPQQIVVMQGGPGA